jgi:CubicO group peptidase (beta-lactamase class C family)
MLLTNPVGRPISEFMTEMLWHPMGAENQTHWLTDFDHMEMAFTGLNAIARDYAKLGEIYRLGGLFNGLQVVPAQWVQASITSDASHLIAGDNPASGWPLAMATSVRFRRGIRANL